ncbi:hypothetical protein [Evansella clarkii]|uniref:hypothetical protein n=1 Tax=Evansella clarkii TaxID=79879 RepID=UPI00142F83D0|nr:hypothetical protein [Evansella clarkii]
MNIVICRVIKQVLNKTRERFFENRFILPAEVGVFRFSLAFLFRHQTRAFFERLPFMLCFSLSFDIPF